MEKRPSVSAAQIFSMLFISRMVVSMTYGTLLIGDSDIWDHILSALISFLLTFFLVFPIYKLYYADEKMSVFDNLCELMKNLGKFIIFVYVIYYLVVGVHTLAVFNNFILNAVNPPISLTFLSIILLASSCYAAYEGLEALARTANFILVATTASFLFLIVSLIYSVEPVNFGPFMYHGSESFFEGIAYMISQSSCIPALAVLLPMGKGNKKMGFWVWNTAVYGIFSIMILVIVGTMGDFAYTQLFPVYTASGIGKFGSFRHLDSLYLGIWLSGIFLKLSLFLLLAGEGLKKIWGEKIRKISIVIFGIFMSFPTFFPDFFSILRNASITNIFLVSVIVLSVIIPGILILEKRIKLKNEKVKIDV